MAQQNDNPIKVLGVTDDRCICECCGKQGLKRVVALDIDGIVAYYGVDCAARALKGNNKKSSCDEILRIAAGVQKVRNEVRADGTIAPEVAAKLEGSEGLFFTMINYGAVEVIGYRMVKGWERNYTIASFPIGA